MVERNDNDPGSTRYGRGGPGGGNQDQGERKDDRFESRQGGDQSRDPQDHGQRVDDSDEDDSDDEDNAKGKAEEDG